MAEHLEQLIQLSTSSQLPPPISKKVQSCLKQFQRIPQCLENKRDELNALEGFLKSPGNISSQGQVMNIAKILEKYFLGEFPGKLEINASELEIWLQSDIQSSETLEEMFPKFLYQNIKKEQSSFSSFWNYLGPMLNHVGLFNSITLRSFAKSILFENPHTDDSEEMNYTFLPRFLELFFGPIDQYKAIKWTNDAIMNSLGSRALDSSVFHSQEKFILRSEYVPSKYRDSVSLPKKEVVVTSTGVEDSPRMCADGVIVFGRGDGFCDIPLPVEDPLTETVQCLITHNSDNRFHIIDTSATGNVGLRLTRANGFVCLKTGTRIKFSASCVIEIERIDNELPGDDELIRREADDPDADLEADADLANPDEIQFTQYRSRMVIKHIEGPMKGTKEAIKFNPKDPKDLIIGKGGGGVDPELYFPKETGISTTHGFFRFRDQEWYIMDNNSTNHTHLLLKNSQESNSRSNSMPFDLFGTLPNTDQGIYITIGNYKFLCERR